MKTKCMFIMTAFLPCFFLAIVTTARDPAAAADERFADNRDGTVTDNATGLTWLRNAHAFGRLAWSDATQACRSLAAGTIDGLRDGSEPGDWRLPDHHELRTFTQGYVFGGALPEDHPFEAVQDAGYWTRSAGYDPERAWTVRPGRRADPAFDPIDNARAVWPVRGEAIIVHKGTPPLDLDYETLTPGEKRRAERNALWDFKHLRRKSGFVVEHSESFLHPPEGYPGYRPLEDFSIATTPPKVRFQVLPDLVPEYFSVGEAYQAGWANWAAVTRSEANRFYLAAGDHRGRGSQLNLYEYRPEQDEDGVLERVLDVSAALGWHNDMYTDGKLHGYMDIMPDGTLWAATHRGPAPTDEWYAAGYRGAWLFSFNIHTGAATNWGVPMIGQELPSHRLDRKRGIFFATGHQTTAMLCWDVNAKRVRYAGSPPNGWIWHARSMFVNETTGIFWGVETSESPYRFISFDPERNRFHRHDVEVPGYPGSGRQYPHGAWATGPDRDGWHYMDFGGVFTRFRPDRETGPEVEVLGVTAAEGRFPVLQMALCPEKRFVYWTPRRNDTMVIKQYDIETGSKKIIGFLTGHIWKNYGLDFGNGVWGMNISTCGSFLVIMDNGGFGRRFWGHPVLFVVSIPASERM